MRRAFPWGFTVQKILSAVRPQPFLGDHVFVGSDYAGNHKRSEYLTYAYLVVDNQPTSWVAEMRSLRSTLLPDGRRMSFKRLGDPERLKALVPFLQIADTLVGHLVVFAVDKKVRLLPVGPSETTSIVENFNLRARWNPRALGDALLKCVLFSLVSTHWSQSLADVTWITDQDESVGNETRLDDVHQMAARFSSMYARHPHRVFAMNTTAIDSPNREFEDLLAVSDLAAGAVAELCTTLHTSQRLAGTSNQTELEPDKLQEKSDLLVDWFWYGQSRLGRVCIVIDKAGPQFRVFKLDQQA